MVELVQAYVSSRRTVDLFLMARTYDIKPVFRVLPDQIHSMCVMIHGIKYIVINETLPFEHRVIACADGIAHFQDSVYTYVNTGVYERDEKYNKIMELLKNL